MKEEEEEAFTFHVFSAWFCRKLFCPPKLRLSHFFSSFVYFFFHSFLFYFYTFLLSSFDSIELFQVEHNCCLNCGKIEREKKQSDAQCD